MKKNLYGFLHGFLRTAVLVLVLSLLTGCSQNLADESSGESGSSRYLTNDTTIVYDVAPQYVFIYAENQTEDYPTTQGAYRFAQLVNERTEGRIRIRVYANAQLGDETSTLEQLRFGGIDFARCSLSTMTPYSEMSNVLMLPYLYRDADHMWEVLEGEIGEKVADSFTSAGLIHLAWYDAGVRNFYFTKPVSSLEEMNGLIIRVQPVEMMEDMIQLLGASALPVSYENVYSAIQRGEADGAENNWPSYETMGHNEVAPYYLLDEHMRVPEIQIASASTWNQLSEEDRKILRECAALSADYERQLWSAREEDARQRVLSEGCTVITLSEEEKMKFHDAMRPLYEKYCGEYMGLVDQIREIGFPEEAK